MSRSVSEQVVVADGYGITLTVSRGHLIVHDGIGSHRRTRRYPRIERDLRRILILGHTGSVSLEAMRWCTERGIAVVQLDADNKIITLTVVPGLDDARLRRAQAHANLNETGLRIAQVLLGAKIDRQANVAQNVLAAPFLAATIRGYLPEIETAASIAECLDAESQAANAYFGGWANTVHIRFAQRDRTAVPEHWHRFASRQSPIMRGRTPRVATTPINAMLNYLYALAEIECRIALITLGLDPGLGIVHVDAKARDSLALDLLEVVRPDVDRYVLDLLARRHFTAADFVETRDGNCRLAPLLAHDLAASSQQWVQAVAPYAERVAHLLAETTSRRARSTPLTHTNRQPARPDGARPARRPRSQPAPLPAMAATCRVCGAVLVDKRRQLCAACWPRTRATLATERARNGRAAIAAGRRNGVDPTHTQGAKAARAASLSARKREQLAWDSGDQDEVDFDPNGLPQLLAGVPLREIRQATGLSVSACSQIRSGHLKPHRRHWPALIALLDDEERPAPTRSGPDSRSKLRCR
jgi:CRISPR-associated endonuclease Cas1